LKCLFIWKIVQLIGNLGPINWNVTVVASCSTMITEETKKIVHKHVLSCVFDAAEELLEIVNSEGMVT